MIMIIIIIIIIVIIIIIAAPVRCLFLPLFPPLIIEHLSDSRKLLPSPMPHGFSYMGRTSLLSNASLTSSPIDASEGVVPASNSIDFKISE